MNYLLVKVDIVEKPVVSEGAPVLGHVKECMAPVLKKRKHLRMQMPENGMGMCADTILSMTIIAWVFSL